MNRSLFWNYVAHSLEDDLSDISKVYFESGGCFLVATDLSGKVVGCAGLEGKSLNSYEVRRVSVDGNCRGHGLGRRLMKRLEEECGKGTMTLGTTSIQYAAQALYQKTGYVVSKRLPLVNAGFLQYIYNLETCIYEKDH